MRLDELAEWERQMAQNIGNGDWEVAHGEADKILIAFLRELGYGRLCDLWDQVGKWYA